MRRASILILVAVCALAAACSAGAQSGSVSPAGGAGGGSATTTAAGPSAAGTAGPSAATGTDPFEGTLTSSGQYAATWKVAAGSEANPFNAAANPSLTSDKGTFGNIAVQPDGSVAFGSAAAELTNVAYKGTGAKVTLDTTGQFVCAFTLDSDLTGTRDGAILHLSGGMTVHWTLGVGEQNCP
jgi:hypothetical protein